MDSPAVAFFKAYGKAVLKRCRTCGEAKPLMAFGVSRNETDGRNLNCKQCVNIRNDKRRKGNDDARGQDQEPSQETT